MLLHKSNSGGHGLLSLCGCLKLIVNVIPRPALAAPRRGPQLHVHTRARRASSRAGGHGTSRSCETRTSSAPGQPPRTRAGKSIPRPLGLCTRTCAAGERGQRYDDPQGLHLRVVLKLDSHSQEHSEASFGEVLFQRRRGKAPKASSHQAHTAGHDSPFSLPTDPRPSL